VSSNLLQIQRFLQSRQPAPQLGWQHFLLALFPQRHQYNFVGIYLLIGCNHLGLEENLLPSLPPRPLFA
jgi:hypothetical protein